MTLPFSRWRRRPGGPQQVVGFLGRRSSFQEQASVSENQGSLMWEAPQSPCQIDLGWGEPLVLVLCREGKAKGSLQQNQAEEFISNCHSLPLAPSVASDPLAVWPCGLGLCDRCGPWTQAPLEDGLATVCQLKQGSFHTPPELDCVSAPKPFYIS